MSEAEQGLDGLAAVVSVAIDGLLRDRPEAVPVLYVLALLAPDDIPRRLLVSDPSAIPPGDRSPFMSRSALNTAVVALVERGVIHEGEAGLGIHRSNQGAVRCQMPEGGEGRWAAVAARFLLAALPDIHVTRTWLWALRLIPHALVVVEHLRRLEEAPRLEVELRRVTARFMSVQGQLSGAWANLEVALRVIEGMEPGSRLHGSVLNGLADVHFRLGSFTEASRLAEQAVEIHRRVPPSSTGEAGDATMTVLLDGEPGRAEAGSRTAMSTATAQTPPLQVAEDQATSGAQAAEQRRFRDPELSADLRVLGQLSQSRGDVMMARAHFLDALQWLVDPETGNNDKGDRAEPGPDGTLDPEYVEVLDLLLDLYTEVDRHDLAADILTEAIELRGRMGPDFADDLHVSLQLKRLLTGDADPLEVCRDLSERLRASYGPHSQNTADGQRLVGRILTSMGRQDEARAALIEALGVDFANLGDAHYRIANGHMELMRLEVVVADVEAARAELIATLEVIARIPKQERPVVLRVLKISDELAAFGAQPEQRPFLDVVAQVVALSDLDDATVMHFHRGVSRGLVRAGETALAAHHLDVAEHEYADALAIARLTTDSAFDDIDAELGLGLVAAAGGDLPRTLAHLRSVVVLFASEGTSEPVWSLVRRYSQARGVGYGTPVGDQAVQEILDEAIRRNEVTAFRGRIETVLPAGWFVKESITLLSADGQANIIASGEPLDGTIDTQQYAHVQGELLRTEFPEFEEHWCEPRSVLGGREGIMRSFSWTPDGGARVTQIQVYYASDERGYTSTATTPTENFAEIEELLLLTLHNLTLRAT